MDETFIWRDAANEWSWFPEDRPEDAIAHPSSDGPRFGVIHAGTAAGFLDDAMCVWRTNPDLESKASLTAERFEEWFENTLVPCLTAPSLIVMDNASFHKRCRRSISEWSVAQLRTRLTRRGVQYEAGLLRDDLVTLVKEHCPPLLVVEAIALAAGHQVLFLPPYHPRLNPIENMWGVVKTHLRRLWRTARVTDDEFTARITDAFDAVDGASWAGAVEKSYEHAKSLVNYDQVADDAVRSDLDTAAVPPLSDSESEHDEPSGSAAAAFAAPPEMKAARVGGGAAAGVAGGAAAVDARVGTRASTRVPKPSVAVLEALADRPILPSDDARAAKRARMK